MHSLAGVSGITGDTGATGQLGVTGDTPTITLKHIEPLGDVIDQVTGEVKVCNHWVPLVRRVLQATREPLVRRVSRVGGHFF